MVASSARSTHGRSPPLATRAATGTGVPGADGRERARPRAGARRSSPIVPASRDVVEVAARRLRVLGHPTRLQLLEVLANGPRSVTNLASDLDMEHQLVSKHLTELFRCEVVVRRQEGNFALYSLPDALTLKAVALVCRSVVDDRARLARLAEDAQPSSNSQSAG